MRKPDFIARQGRRPTGLLGHVVARIMARETSTENDRALDLLDLKTEDNLIDIGCGHGRTLSRAAQIIESGRLAGVDFSDVMLKVASRRNRCHIASGRMELKLADSAGLPFDDDSFDKGLSVHTIYFWPNPARHMAEVMRVLKPGGVFVLGFRSSEDARAVAAFPASVYRFPPVDEVEMALRSCGFADLQTTTERVASRLMTWIAARKPAAQHATRLEPVQKETVPCA